MRTILGKSFVALKVSLIVILCAITQNCGLNYKQDNLTKSFIKRNYNYGKGTHLLILAPVSNRARVLVVSQLKFSDVIRVPKLA